MNQEEKALKITCRMCHAGVGERCFDLTAAGRRWHRRKKTVCRLRIDDAKARGI